MDLIVAILSHLEQAPSEWAAPPASLPDYSDAAVAYHLKLAAQAGLILRTQGSSFSDARVQMTWAGHELLAQHRRPSALTA